MNARAVITAALAAVVALITATPAVAQDRRSIAITVDSTHIDTRLGEKFKFRSTFTNHGSTPAGGLIAHLNIASFHPGTYVDPEDWSSERTRYLPVIAPGRSVTTTWDMQAVNDGSFAVYVALLDERITAPLTGPTVRLEVASRRTLNPEGMIPIALGVPLLLAALMVGVQLKRRRSSAAVDSRDQGT